MAGKASKDSIQRAFRLRLIVRFDTDSTEATANAMVAAGIYLQQQFDLLHDTFALCAEFAEIHKNASQLYRHCHHESGLVWF